MTAMHRSFRMLLKKVLTELKYMEQVEITLTSACPKLLTSYSKEAFHNLTTEILILADDEKDGQIMSPAERYLHQLRKAKWRRLYEIIWEEISTRGHEVCKEIIQQTLNNNDSLFQQFH